MRALTIIIFSLVAVGSIGTSYALVTHNEPVNVFGNLQVINGNLIVDKTGGGDSGLSVRNDGGAATFQFFDVDTNQVYKFVLNNDGNSFNFIDSTHARADMVIKTATGNIGIGTINPQERLDVNGNLRVTGNIVSPGDICIGTCP